MSDEEDLEKRGELLLDLAEEFCRKVNAMLNDCETLYLTAVEDEAEAIKLLLMDNMWLDLEPLFDARNIQMGICSSNINGFDIELMSGVMLYDARVAAEDGEAFVLTRHQAQFFLAALLRPGSALRGFNRLCIHEDSKMGTDD